MKRFACVFSLTLSCMFLASGCSYFNEKLNPKPPQTKQENPKASSIQILGKAKEGKDKEKETEKEAGAPIRKEEKTNEVVPRELLLPKT